jgi:hypothetical protein
VSDRIAALVREPLSGRDTECPLSMDTPIPVASVGNVVANLIAIHELSAKVLPQSRVMNLPALTVSVGEILHALKAHAALARVGHVRIVPDPVIEKIVADWPKRFVSQDATRLGLLTEGDFAEIIADYLSHRSGDHDA